MNGLNNEEQLLLELCRVEPRPAAVRDLLERHPLDPQRLVTVAREHHLGAYALDRLQRLGVSNGHAGQLARLARREVLAVACANLAFKGELGRIRAALEARGIDCLVLKGLSLDFSGLRAMNDLDLLVPAGGIVEAIEAGLSLEGYRFRLRRHVWDSGGRLISGHLSEGQRRQVLAQGGWNSEYQLYNPPLGILVELHTRLLQAPPDGYSAMVKECAALQNEVEYFWRQKVFDPALRGFVLRPEHSLVLMCLHTALKRAPGSHFRLSNLVDIDRLTARQVDWDEVLRTARRFTVGHLVEFSLRLSQHLVGTPVPAEVLDRLPAGSSWGSRMAAGLHLKSGVRSLRADSTLGSKCFVVLANYLKAETLWDRVRWALLLPVLVPSRHRLAQILRLSPTSPLLPFAYLVHPVRWLWRVGRRWSRRDHR